MGWNSRPGEVEGKGGVVEVTFSNLDQMEGTGRGRWKQGEMGRER